MNCSVDWNTHIITIPKSYLTLVSGTLYELNTNQLRLDLKELEVTDPGIVHPITHRHNTEITIAGTTYARTIEILAPYSFQFEDGQYSVRLVGSNNNLFDVGNGILVQNQVQIIATNSAGLITTSGGNANPVTSYNNIIVIDVINGNPGGAIPNGTMDSPVDNLIDAMSLSLVTGIKTFYVIGDLEVGGLDLSGITIVGNTLDTDITLLVSDNSTNLVVKNCHIDGIVNNGIFAHNCFVGTLTNVSGYFFNCTLRDTIITLGNNKESQFINCNGENNDIDGAIIDMGNTGQSLNMVNYNGTIKLVNKFGVDNAAISLNSGEVKLGSDVRKGKIVLRGLGELTQDLSRGAEVTDQLVNNSARIKPPGGVIRINS